MAFEALVPLWQIGPFGIVLGVGGRLKRVNFWPKGVWKVWSFGFGIRSLFFGVGLTTLNQEEFGVPS